jgi:hypothetical protein
MAQSNYNIPNDSAPAVRAQLNAVFQSIASNNSGTAAPATTFAHQWWYDSTANILKQRNAADSAWIDIGTFDQGAGTFSPAGVAQLTQGQAEDPASTVFGQVSGQRLAQASAGAITGAITEAITDLAEGAAGAPRVVPEALSIYFGGTSSGSITIIDLDDVDYLLVPAYVFAQTGSGSATSTITQALSTNNGASFGSATTFLATTVTSGNGTVSSERARTFVVDVSAHNAIRFTVSGGRVDVIGIGV